MGFIRGLFKITIFLIVILAAAYCGYVYGQTVLQESLFEVAIPINQTFDFELNQSVEIPIKTQIIFPFSDYFIINESVPINTFIDLDEVVRVTLDLPTGDTLVDVPIKKRIPINTSVSVYKKMALSKNISLDVDKNLVLVINKNISVPVNMEVTTKIPVPEWAK